MNKKVFLFVFSFLLIFTLSACNKETETDLEYTPKKMIEAILEFNGTDVSGIVAEYDFSKMTSEEKEELLIYLYNYAHYKNLTSEEFLSDFSNLSPETLSLLKEELESCNFDKISPDEKIDIGQKLSESYAFYETDDSTAIYYISSIRSISEKEAEKLLEDEGFFNLTDNKKRSEILYKYIVLSE